MSQPSTSKTPPQKFRRWRVSFEVGTYTYYTAALVRQWVGKLLTERELTTLKVEEITE